MERLRLTLYLLLLFGARSSFARDVFVPQPAEPREFPCPLDEDIAPCTCTNDPETYDLFMDCSQVKNDQQLIDAFNSTFPFTTFSSLTIDQTDAAYDLNILKTLTQDSFGAVSFEHVDIRGTTLTTVLEGAFLNSHETLISLRLSSNQLSSFTFEIIGEFKKLHSLTLNGNQFNGDLIQPISSASLTILNLNSNPKINVGGDFVRDCPALKQLLLRNTGQSSVPLLEESPISMIEGLENIIKLDFAHNSITILETNIFHTGVTSRTIQTLDLSNNDISIVFPNFVSELVKEAETLIDLSFNSIELMDQAVWEGIFMNILPGKVNMGENPLTCGCDMAWLVVNSPQLMAALSDETTCLTGNAVSTLDPNAFSHCP